MLPVKPTIKKQLQYLILLLCLFSVRTYSQVTAAGLKEVLTSKEKLKAFPLENTAEVVRFYELVGYQPLWMNKDCQGRRSVLLENFDNANHWGLEKNEYSNSYIQTILRHPAVLRSTFDSMTAEMKITDAAIRFFSHIASGSKAPDVKYDGLYFKASTEAVVKGLAHALAEEDLYSLSNQLEPTTKEYQNAVTLVRLYNKSLNDPLFREAKITNKNVNKQNLPLVSKLRQLGFTSKADSAISDKELLQAIQKAQKAFGLLNDGVVRGSFLNELNVPLGKRRQELCATVNAIRWISSLKKQGPLVVVNIPSASLFYYEDEKLKLDSRMVVGKRSTPTSTLSSKITEVVLYPYWNVPRSIATKELLPIIKRNINYLQQNNYQVLSESGKILDPRSIPWSALSASNFPYHIRQSTGCDNSLGLIKLNFHSPFGIYIHDTPSKGLFFLNKRYFSHGCMRVEKAVELAQALVSEKAYYIDSIARKGCLFNQPPISLKVIEPVNLVVLYHTAWFDGSGNIYFLEDVYGKNKTISQSGLYASK